MVEGYKCFHRKVGVWLAVAEVSIVDFDTVFRGDFEIDLPKDRWYFFNRLSVPIPIRRRGLATELMRELIEWADINRCNIVNPINPYGDLDMEQLVRFYKKFGFVEIRDGIVYRLAEEIKKDVCKEDKEG